MLLTVRGFTYQVNATAPWFIESNMTAKFYANAPLLTMAMFGNMVDMSELQ
jgi:hypothetical protein